MQEPTNENGKILIDTESVPLPSGLSHDKDVVKKHIVGFLKKNPLIETTLGPLKITGPLLGQGGNSLVYPADFSGDAVIKILAEEVSKNPTTQYIRFRNEYQKLVRLKPHEHVIKLFHFDHALMDGVVVPYIVMERCPQSLKKFIEIQGPLSPEQLTEFFKQLCSALGHLHESGIIHRDIKPENILVRSNGEYVLADFGIAFFDSVSDEHKRLTQNGDRVANLFYSPQEQFDASITPMPTFDLFALGQVAYSSVKGEVIRGTSPSSLFSHDPAYAKFDQVILRLTRQSPDERYQSADEVMQALKRYDQENNEYTGSRSNLINVRDSILEFEKRLRSTLPGKTGIVHVDEKTVITRILTAIGTNCAKFNLWWTRGHSNMELPTDFECLPNGDWVIGNLEMSITDLWVSRPNGKDDACFVLIRSAPMPSFGIYTEKSEYDQVDLVYEYEEAGLFLGQYITRPEYDDGYALINSEPIRTKGAQLRRRYLIPHYLMLTTKFSRPLVSKRYGSNADDIVDAIIEESEKADKVDVVKLAEIWNLLEHPSWEEWN